MTIRIDNSRILAAAILLAALVLALPRPTVREFDATRPSLNLEPIVGPVDTHSDPQTSTNTAGAQTASPGGPSIGAGSGVSQAPPAVSPSGGATWVNSKTGAVTNVISTGGNATSLEQIGPDNSRGDTTGPAVTDNSQDDNSTPIANGSTIGTISSPLLTGLPLLP